MLGDVLWLIGGLSLLLVGGEAVVRGATGLARGFGVSPLTIGLTVVAFGTSAPELAVNVIAAWQGRGEISFGSIIGSNLANIGLILGLTALLRPVIVQNVLIHRELPMMLLATGAVLVMAFDTRLGGGEDLIDRGDGLLLLMLFGVFLYYTVRELITTGTDEVSGTDELPAPGGGRARHGVTTAIGLVSLVAGGHVSVEASVSLARALGVPEVVVGLTVVAVGTSLPELAAAVVASLRGHVELATGNVIGSNIFNLLLVAGVSATVRPLPIPDSGGLDLLALMALSLMLLVMSTTHKQRIVRVEAVVLLGLYLAYLTWRTVFGI